jgi:hypothetical protein
MNSLGPFSAEVFLHIIPRSIVGLFLIAGGAAKIASLSDFEKLVLAYNILPERMVPAFCRTLPVVELVVGSAFLFKVLTPFPEFTAAALFMLFMLAIATNLLRGNRELPCGCFGRKADVISWHLVARDMAMIGLALVSTGRLKVLSLLLFAVYGFSVAVQSAAGPGKSSAHSFT